MIYTTWVNESIIYQGDDLESAIRSWDGETYNRSNCVGGISAKSDYRDGWILHVKEDGIVYFNPNLTERD